MGPPNGGGRNFAGLGAVEGDEDMVKAVSAVGVVGFVGVEVWHRGCELKGCGHV